MLRTVAATAVVLGLSLCSRAAAHAAEEKPVNLLRLPSAKVEATSVPGGPGALAPLTDGDPKTVADIDATEAAPLEIVFGFGGADVAPEGVRVTLPEKGGAEPPAARVEVLVSTVSPHAGFRSARADPLDAAAQPKTFEFLPLHARWILVRLTPAPGAKRLTAAEVEVLGRPGMPESRYEFAESPAKAFDVLQRLEKTSALKVSVTPDEKAMFAKAQAARLDARTFAEAALLASGVTDSARRAGYLKRLDDLEPQARSAVARSEGRAAKGDALLRWLHQGPMSKGYVSGQTDLHTVLDTGTFNCVSSATLFNCLALRMGLDARAIEVPTHAFAIVYEGTRHADVETTTPDGFDPARDPAKVARFEAATGFRYIADIHRDQRREVEEAGLAAIIYYNHGVALAQEKRYHEALLAYFRAMSLDPEFASAVKNALGVLAKWGVEQAEAGKPEAALEVIGTGLALAPKDVALVNNRLWVWQRWSEREIDAGRPDEALAILAKAAAAVPDGGFEGRRAWVFLKAGEKHADAKRWEEALAAVEPGLARLDGKAREEVVSWRANLYLRWFDAEVRAKRFEPAALVIEKGLAAVPGQPGLTRNAGYLAQEWARHLATTEDEGRAREVLRALRTRFAGNEDVVEAGANHARRAAYQAADAGKYQEALAALHEAKDLLPDDKARQQVGVYVFDNWAKSRMKAGQWAEAADIYAQARERYPEEHLIAQNIAYLAQEWSKAAYKSGGATEAARVTQVLKEKFPGVEFAGKSSANELKRVVNDLVRSGKHEEALKALDEGKALLEGDKDADDLWVFVYDAWAKAEMQAGRFAGAADVYAAGLVRLPKNRDLLNNLGYLAQEAAKQLASTDPAKAVELLRSLRLRFPDVDDVTQAAKRHVLRSVQERAATGPEAALADLEAWKDLLPKESDVENAAAGVYDRWAQPLVEQKKWQEAVDVYAKGLEHFPKSSHLKNNAVATWFQWAKTFSDAKQWDAAIAVYDKGLERMPDTSLFKQNRTWCEEQKKKS
jgi:tetratricopeptide (TPR) repeat protein